MITILSVNFPYRIIKLTSPMINYFIIVGTISMYASVYFYLIPALTPSAAQAGCLVGIIMFIALLDNIYIQILTKFYYTDSGVVVYSRIYAGIWRPSFQVMESLYNFS